MCVLLSFHKFFINLSHIIIFSAFYSSHDLEPETLLISSARYGYLEIVKDLIRTGISLDFKNRK